MRARIIGFALLVVFLAVAPVVAQDIREVPREATVIFENIEGRVAIPDNMNPYISGQYLDWGMWQATQEALFYLNYETGEVMPWLSSGYTFNDDNSEVTISIRDGVKWADGTPFTAHDVVFTINMLKDNPELQYSFDMQQWVADISAPDDSTVVMTLTRPNPRFIVNYFSVRIWDTILVAPKHIWENVDPTTFNNFDLEAGLPMGTGAYRLVRSTETEQVFDRLDNWWAAETGFHPMPAPERAIWLAAPSEELRAAMMANNELDAGWIFNRSSFEVAQSRNPNIVGWTEDLPYAYLDPCPRYLSLNNKIPPFDDREVRWAVNAAIDRDVIVAIAFEGMTDAAATLYPTYTPLQAFLDRNAALFEQYDVLGSDDTLINTVMEGKGYVRDGEGLWVDGDGERITFTMISRSGETDQVRMGTILVDQMRDAGFDASFQPLENAIFYSDVSTGASQAWVTGLCGSVSDPYETFSRFHSRFSGPLGEPAPGDNASRFENAEFDEIVDAMAVLAADDEEFMALADQALEIWLRELPVIPLVQARLLTPFNNTYWTNWPTSDNNYIHPGHWWVTGELMLINIQPSQ
ncbi:MAG: ABC transporter substrate-binding protein [Chloroflexi bacterium]|nr:ABC transporter substrate-binding protein [Chloroflexota bacterium]